MSIADHVTHLLDRSAEVDGKARYGARVERDVFNYISDGQGAYVTNPVLPHPDRPGVFMESDLLIYEHGRLHIIEVKGFRGTLTHPERYRQVTRERLVIRGWLFRRRRVETYTETVSDGYDDRRIVQTKYGNHGEGTFVKEHPNPLGKTRFFASCLRAYLVDLDPRFARFHVSAVVAFTESADISGIRRGDGTIVYVSEIPDYVSRRADPRFMHRRTPWVVDGLRSVPTWDRIQTVEGRWVNGILRGDALTGQEAEAACARLPFRDIVDVKMHPRGPRGATMGIVTLADGTTRTLLVGDQILTLNRFGTIHEYRLSALARIVPSAARIWNTATGQIHSPA